MSFKLKESHISRYLKLCTSKDIDGGSPNSSQGSGGFWGSMLGEWQCVRGVRTSTTSY